MIYLGIDGEPFYISKDSAYDIVRSTIHRATRKDVEYNKLKDVEKGDIVIFMKRHVKVDEVKGDILKVHIFTPISKDLIIVDEDSFDQ